MVLKVLIDKKLKSFFYRLEMDLLTMKTAKGGRKISLPWFRQSSVQQSHAALSRQHTIDTPGSFRSYIGSKKLQVKRKYFDFFNNQNLIKNCDKIAQIMAKQSAHPKPILDINFRVGGGGTPEECRSLRHENYHIQLRKLSYFVAWKNLLSCHSLWWLTQVVPFAPFAITSAHVFLCFLSFSLHS